MRPWNLNILLLMFSLSFCNCNRIILQENSAIITTMHDIVTNSATNTFADTIKPPLELAWDYDTMSGFGANAGVATDSVLFVANLQGEVHAIHTRTGKGLGKYNFGSSIVSAPVIDGSSLYVALTRGEENLVSYNLRNGTVRWRLKIDDIETSPLVVGYKLFVVTLRGKMICVDKETAQIIWTYEIPKTDRVKFVRSSPVSDSNTIVFGCDDGMLYAVAVNDGKLVWRSATRGSIVSSPSIQDGKVFVGSFDESFYVFDLKNGNQIWKKDLHSKIYTAPVVWQKQVFVCTASRMVYSLNSETGETIWQVRLDGVLSATPLLPGNVLYVGCTDKNLYALDANTGRNIWQYKIEGRIKTTPITVSHFVFLFIEDHTVLSLREEKQP